MMVMAVVVFIMMQRLTWYSGGGDYDVDVVVVVHGGSGDYYIYDNTNVSVSDACSLDDELRCR